MNRRSSKSRSSSSRRKKVAKITSFSMGFRSYIREFLGAILLFLCPSLPWCFPIRELPFEQKEQQEQEQQQQQEEKVAKITSFSMGFRSYIGGFGRNFDAFPSFTAMVSSHPEAAF